MNKKDKRTLNELKSKFEKANENIELPDSLSEESIENLLIEQEQETVKKSKIKPFRYIATAAAAVVVLAVSVTVLKMNGLPKNVWNNEPKEPLVTDVVNPDEIGEENIGVDYFKSYSEIENAFLKIQKEKRKNDRKGLLGSEIIYEATAEKSNDNAQPTSDEYGKTNVQVDGVDESDIMKNDGKYLYVVNEENGINEISIVSLLPADNMKAVSTISLKEGFNGLYVYEDRLVVVLQKYDIKSLSDVIIFDISDRANPKQIGKFSQDGYILTTRMVNNVLYLVSSYSLNNYNYQIKIDEEAFKKECIPTVSINEAERVRIPASNIYALKDNEETCYLVISAIDVKDAEKVPTSKAIIGAGSESYCTEDALYISRAIYENKNNNRNGIEIADALVGSSAQKTEIYQFEIDGMNIRFKNSGSVKGGILNQFSMDEYNGYFRIATSEGTKSSRVTVLDSKLNVVGEITDIAPGETIYAVRFMGDTGYVVTFEQTDPLFVMDLSNPKEPKITGELKIPGFSNYLHPYGDKYLIGIGQTGDENGTTNGLKISLFDISDMKNPKEVDKIEIANAYSNARYNHKNVLYSEKLGLIGFDVMRRYEYYEPYTTYTNDDEYVSISAPKPSYLEYSQFETFTVENGKLIQTGKYATKTMEEVKNENSYASACRGTYINNILYMYAYDTVASFSMQTGNKLDSVNLK